MKTIETRTLLFSYSELTPEAQERVRDNIHNQETELFCLEEMADSLKAICSACCVKLANWSFGPYCRNWKAQIRHTMEDESGPRALAWFLKVLIEHGYTRPKRFAEMEFPGVCGFTGVCYDDDAAETIWENLMDGATVKSAFDQVAYKFCQNAEAEEDYQRSDECILEYLDQSAEIYTEDGEEF